MKHKKLGIGAVLAFGLLLFCSALAAESWTILVYMAADNNLWQSGMQSINLMESVDLPANLKLVVQSDLPADSPYPGGQRRLIRKDDSELITSPIIQNLGVVNSGDPNTLRDFARWGFGKYPSSRRALFIWGHGNSWYKDAAPRWICPDEGSGDLINVYNGELKQALSGLPALDLLLFDACSMQSLEVISEVRHAAARVIASEELVPARGFPYHQFLGDFDGSYTVDQISERIVDSYLEAYSPGGAFNPWSAELCVTCSAIETANWEALLGKFSEFVGRHKHHAHSLLVSRQGCWEMNDGDSDIDFRQFFTKVRNDASGLLEFDAAELLALWDNATIKAGNLGLDADVGSAALWFPWHRQYFDALWQMYYQLDFAATLWLSLLNQAFGPDLVPPEQPALITYTQSLGSVIFKFRLPRDPDALSLIVRLEELEGKSEIAYPVAWGAEIVTLRIPVKKNSRLEILCRDPAQNESQNVAYNISIRPLPISLEVHPNPMVASSGSAIRWYLPADVVGQASLSIYDLKGRKLLEKNLGELNAGEGFILSKSWEGFENLSPGVYLLRIKIGDQPGRCKLTIL